MSTDLRGAQPDAECPRCGYMQPPGGVLVTCSQCGLVFPPHEIAHRALSPRRPIPPAPWLLGIREHRGKAVYRWTDDRPAGGFLIAVAIGVATLLWTSNVIVAEKIIYSAFLVAIGAYGIVRMWRTPRLWLTDTHVRSSRVVLELADIARVDADRGQLVVETHEGEIHVLATAKDVRIADHLAAVLDDKRRQPSGPPQIGGGGTT